MSNIPIRDISATGTPAGDSYIVFDDGAMKKGTVSSMADAVRPVASQGEAQAGTDNTKVMTPLRVKQSIASEVGVSIASSSQGALANTAVQPSRSITAGTGLTGGGDLSANRSIALSTTSIASLAKADTAVQSIVAGTNVTVNNTDPLHPIINVSGSGASPANPTASVGLTTVNGSATTFMRSDAAPPISQSITPTWTGLHNFRPASGSNALDIRTAGGTIDQGFYIGQVGPTSGSYPGQVSFNKIEANIGATITGPGGPGDYNGANVAALQCSLGVKTGYDGIEAYGASFGCVTLGATTTESDIVGMSCGAVQNYSGNSRIYGGTSAGTVAANGSSPTLIGIECAASQNNPTISNVPNRMAVNAISYAPYQASTFDAAYAVSGGNPGGQFEHALALYTKQGELADALSTTGDFIFAETAQTVGSIINVPLLDITNHVINTKHAKLTGSAVFTLGDDNSGTVPGYLQLFGPNASNPPQVQFKIGSGVSGNPNWAFGPNSENDLVAYSVGIGEAVLALGATGNAFFYGNVNAANLPNGAWTSYNPTMASASGSGTWSSASSRYKKTLSSTVSFSLQVTLTNAGTASGDMTFTLPLTSANAGINYIGKGQLFNAASPATLDVWIPANSTIGYARGINGGSMPYVSSGIYCLTIEYECA